MIANHKGPCCACIHELRARLSPLPEQPVRPFTTTLAPPEAVLAAVAVRCQINVMDLRGRSRTRDVTYVRHLAMYMLKGAGYRIAEIGRMLGNRDHSTVMSGLHRIHFELTTRPETAADFEAITATLKG